MEKVQSVLSALGDGETIHHFFEKRHNFFIWYIYFLCYIFSSHLAIILPVQIYQCFTFIVINTNVFYFNFLRFLLIVFVIKIYFIKICLQIQVQLCVMWMVSLHYCNSVEIFPLIPLSMKRWFETVCNMILKHSRFFMLNSKIIL